MTSGSRAKEGPGSVPLPRKPDARTQPALNKAWERMFGSPHTWVAARLKPSKPFDLIPPPSTLREFFEAPPTRYENSSNWCGATIVPDGDRQFVQVYGEWQVPVPATPPHEPKDKPYFSATWIGLDGDRRYLDSSLPQVGTQQDIARSDDGDYDPNYYAWFQWWAPRRIVPQAFEIEGLKITGGCKVMGLIWAIEPRRVLVYMRTFAPDNAITWFYQDAPEYLNGADDTKPKYKPTISGATAEWIVERPTVEIEPTQDPPDLEPFADYNQVTFRHCVAGMAQGPGQATAEKVLTAPRFKRLYETLPRFSRTRFISMPERGADVSELIVKYGGF